MTFKPDEDLYSDIAYDQLDLIEQSDDFEYVHAVYNAIDLVDLLPHEAQRRSSAISTKDGIRLVLPVVGHSTKVYWSSGPPARIEAFLPLPTLN